MTKAPAQLATSDQSNPAVKSNSADMAPSDLKEQFKKLLAQRKQLAQQRRRPGLFYPISPNGYD